MNLGTLRTQAAQFVADPDQTRYTATQYLNAINRAQEQFSLDTKALFKDKTYTSASGDATYDLPTDFMYEKWVKFDGKTLDPISRDTLNARAHDSDWTDDAGTPTHYIIDPEEALKQLLLYPIPEAGDASKTISMRYYPLPAALASDSDTPLNSSALLAQFHMGLGAFAAWLLLLGENLTPELLLKRSALLAIYNDATSKAIETFGNTVSEGIRIRGTRPV